MTPSTGQDDDETTRAASGWLVRLRGQPTQEELAALEAWKEFSFANRDAFDRLSRKLDQSIFLAQTPTGRNRNLDKAVSWHRGAPSRRAVAAGLAVLITLLAGLGVYAQWSTHDDHPRLATLDRRYTNSGAELETISLTDGSKVTLDRGSRLAVRFSAAERSLRLLTGRARFDVAHETARRFVVEADGSTIIAHGTLFDVALARDHVDVLLLHGEIEVRDGRDRRGKGTEGRTLNAGQTLRVAHGRTLDEPQKFDQAATRWAAGMLSFDNRRLVDVVAELNQHNRLKLKLDSDDLGELRVLGAFRADDPLGFADALGAMFHLERRVDRSQILITRKKVGG